MQRQMPNQPIDDNHAAVLKAISDKAPHDGQFAIAWAILKLCDMVQEHAMAVESSFPNAPPS
jgi:hypothetical protein